MDNSRRLTDHEIHQLLGTYKSTRSQEIRDRIVMQYTHLVESVARRFTGTAEPLEDLVQEGFIGLITAVDGYNASKGVKFSTYATHFIIGQIKHHLRDRGKIIKEPAWLQELNQRVTRVIESLSQETGRMPTNAEIASLMGMQEEVIAELLTTREVFKVASLDGGSDQDDDSPASYDMERVKSNQQVEYQLPVEDKMVLQTALQKLKDLEQTVIQEFYFRDRNQTEIARTLGISCNYVSHILRNSTKKLKKILVTDELKEAQKELALIRRRMQEQTVLMEEQSVVDPTTRLYNRRYFDARLDEEINRASRHQYPVAVILIHMAGYDQITRAYGTLRAEDGLRRAAELITEAVRRADIITRFDEYSFGLILPHTGQQARVVANRIARSLSAWLGDSGLNKSRSAVELRLSVAVCPRDALGAADLTADAEERLAPATVTDNVPLAA